MSSRYSSSIAHEVAEREGWTDTTLLDVVLDYIDNQDSVEAFRDYLVERPDSTAAALQVPHASKGGETHGRSR